MRSPAASLQAAIQAELRDWRTNDGQRQLTTISDHCLGRCAGLGVADASSVRLLPPVLNARANSCAKHRWP